MQERFHSLDLLGESFPLGDERVTLCLVIACLPDAFRDLVLLGAGFFYLALKLKHLSIDLQQVVDVNGVVFDPRCFFDDVWMVANKGEIEHDSRYSLFI